jgi:hypothetical protein
MGKRWICSADPVWSYGSLRYRAHVLLAACTCVLLRTVWATLVPVLPVSDPSIYAALIRNLLHAGVYGVSIDAPFAFWPPGTALFYAGVEGVFGEGTRAIVTANILLSALIVVSGAQVARQLLPDRVAILTAWILALWPTLVIYVTIIASELLFLLLITLALQVWLSTHIKPELRGILVGVLIGAAALVRPLALALPIVWMLAWLFGERRKWSEHAPPRAKTLVIVFVSMAVVIAPWTLRNYRLYDDLVLVSTNGGATLWMGNAPGTDGAYIDPPTELQTIPDNKMNRILGERARAFIREDPLAFVWRSIRKLGKIYSNESIGVMWNSRGIAAVMGESAATPLKRFTQATWASIALLVLVGILHRLYSGGRRLLACPAFITIVYFSVVHSVTVAQDRYHLSFATFLAMYAALGFALILNAVTGHRENVTV